MVIHAGAYLKAAMELTRHGSPELTFKLYGHALLNDLIQPLANLPELEDTPHENISVLQKTGTDDQPISNWNTKDQNVLAFCLAPEGEKSRTLMDFWTGKRRSPKTGKPLKPAGNRRFKGF